MKLRLQVRLSVNSSYNWEHSGPVIRLGRNPSCELPFAGEGCQIVSWEHARLDLRPDGLFVCDLGSSNGTYLNGQVIKQSTGVRAGDQISLGQTGPRLHVVEIKGGEAPVGNIPSGGAVPAKPAAPPPMAVAVMAAPAARPLATASPPAALPQAQPLAGRGIIPPAAVPLPRAPLPGPAATFGATPYKASTTRLILLSLQNRHRRMWIFVGLGAFLLLVLVGVIFVLIYRQSANREREELLAQKKKDNDEAAKIKQEEDRKKKEADRKADADRLEREKAKKEEVARLEREKANKRLTGEEIYTRALRSTVYVAVRLKNGMQGNGTGSLIDKKRRLILTAYHVVDNVAAVGVFFPSYDGEGNVISDKEHYTKRFNTLLIPGRVIQSSSQSDLAIIQIDSVPPDVLELPLAASSPSPGSQVHTVGNPGASAGFWAYTFGAVRQVARKRYVFQTRQVVDAFVVETQNPINKGDSGGPVVNGRVQLVAVNSGGGPNLRDGTLSIDIREVKAILAKVPY